MPDPADSRRDGESNPTLVSTSSQEVVDVANNIRVCVGNSVFDCNLRVLQSCSDLFVECEPFQYIMLPEDKITAEEFKKFYIWCFSSRTNLTIYNIREMLKISKVFRLDSLFRDCWKYLVDNSGVDDKITMKLFVIAQRQNLSHAMKHMLPHLRSCFLIFIAYKEIFLRLSAKQLYLYLDSSDISVLSEVDVLFAVARWLDHDWPKRKKFGYALTKLVRFPLMPVWYLVILLRGTGENIVNRLVKRRKIQRLIDKSVILAIKREQVHLANSQLLSVQLNTGAGETAELPVPRLSVCDPTANIYDPENKFFMTYQAFELYLNQLRTEGKKAWKRFAVQEFIFPTVMPKSVCVDPKIRVVDAMTKKSPENEK